MTIHFGTDGWRAVISDTFTYNNLRMVAQAIADAVASDQWDKSGNGGQVPDPHKIMALSLNCLVEKRGMSGAVARIPSRPPA